MKTLRCFMILLVAIALQGCFFGADGDSEKIIGNYFISGDYGFKNVHLGFEDKEFGRIGLIEKPIIAIGLNDEYLIVKRELDKSEYFVLKIMNSSKISDAEKNIIGPLTESEFNKTINELKIQNIKWTRKFKKK